MADRRWERTGKGQIEDVYAVERGQETDTRRNGSRKEVVCYKQGLQGGQEADR